MGLPIAVDARPGSALPGAVTTRIHALWDELADFGAHETDAALAHALRVLSGLVGAQQAFWLGAVRLGTEPDALGGWRIRGVQRMNERRPEDDEVYKLSRSRVDIRLLLTWH